MHASLGCAVRFRHGGRGKRLALTAPQVAAVVAAAASASAGGWWAGGTASACAPARDGCKLGGGEGPALRPQLDGLLDFNRKLDQLSADPAVIPGLGRTSVWGGKYDSSSGEGRTRDLHTLFRIYLEEKLRPQGDRRGPPSDAGRPSPGPLPAPVLDRCSCSLPPAPLQPPAASAAHARRVGGLRAATPPRASPSAAAQAAGRGTGCGESRWRWWL